MSHFLDEIKHSLHKLHDSIKEHILEIEDSSFGRAAREVLGEIKVEATKFLKAVGHDTIKNLTEVAMPDILKNIDALIHHKSIEKLLKTEISEFIHREIQSIKDAGDKIIQDIQDKLEHHHDTSEHDVSIDHGLFFLTALVTNTANSHDKDHSTDVSSSDHTSWTDHHTPSKPTDHSESDNSSISPVTHDKHAVILPDHSYKTAYNNKDTLCDCNSISNTSDSNDHILHTDFVL